MSLLDEVSTIINYVNLVEVETEFATTTSFKGETNTFSSYPIINVVDNENPTQPYQVTSKKYVDDNFQAKSSYLDPTSSVQTQLNSKLSTVTAESTYQPILSNASYLDATSSVQTQLNSKLSSATAESTYQSILSNASYLDATSSVQTQLNSKTTESYVNTQINNLINSAPGTLDTLGEIAIILSSNVNDISTLTTSIAGKVSKTANETVSGILTFSQPPVMSGASISSGTISDSSLASTFLNTSDATSTYLTQTNASNTYQTQSSTTTALNLKANLASPTFTGTLGCSALTSSGLITSTIFTENLISVAPVGGTTYTLNFASGNVFYSSSNPTGNFTVNITNIPTSSSTKQFTFSLIVNTGTYYCTSASAVDTGSSSIVIASAPKYHSGTAPTVGTSVIVIHTFTLVQCFATKYIVYSASTFN
jgi:hypothetical protein